MRPPRHRPRHDLDARDRLRRGADAARHRAARVARRSIRRPARSSTTRRRSGARSSTTVREALAKAGLAAGDIAGIGITNQRETTVVWDRATGKPIHNAIVWQDRRTAPTVRARCAEAGTSRRSRRKTGLLLDPYFSATKIAWLLDNVPGARAAARSRQARLRHHRHIPAVAADRRPACTRPTPPTRRAPLLFDIGKGAWDADLCELFGVPMALLPKVRDCAGEFGVTDAGAVRRRRSASSASPATSRRRRSGRAASSPA